MTVLLGYSVPETLIDDRGRPAKNRIVAVTGPDDYEGVVTSDPDTAVIRLGPLPIGDYTLTYGERVVTVPVFATPAQQQETYDAATTAGGDVAAEEAARIAADAAEAAARAAAEAAEAAARAAADTSETSARAAAVAAEAAARNAADAAFTASVAANTAAIALRTPDSGLPDLLYDDEFSWEAQPGSDVRPRLPWVPGIDHYSSTGVWAGAAYKYLGIVNDYDAAFAAANAFAVASSEPGGSPYPDEGGQFSSFSTKPEDGADDLGSPVGGFGVGSHVYAMVWHPSYGPEGADDPAMLNWVPPGPVAWADMPLDINEPGPVAILDENGVGVIDDIAYVVSGYVYNNNDLTVAAAIGDDYCWPFIEPYDLAAGEWLPRIPMPLVEFAPPDLIEYAYVAPQNDPGGPPYSGWSLAGPFDMDAGDLPVPALPPGADYCYTSLLTQPVTSLVQGGTYSVADVGDTSGAPVPFAAGKYWVLTVTYNDSGLVLPEGAEAIGDALGDRSTYQPPTPDSYTYATEGHIVGVIDGKLYFGGGDGDAIMGVEFFVYDPATQEFTRLADMPAADYPDYNPYGVADGKLWYFGYAGNTVYSYDPAGTDEWVTHTTTGLDVADEVGDEIEGLLIDGRLWFCNYGHSVSFDPATLVGAEGTAILPSTYGVTFLYNGGILLARRSNPAAYFYDPLTDVWSTLTNIDVSSTPTTYTDEIAATTYEGAPYLFGSLTSPDNLDIVGAYGLTRVSKQNSPQVLYGDLHDLGVDVAAMTTDVASALSQAANAAFSANTANTTLAGMAGMKRLVGQLMFGTHWVLLDAGTNFYLTIPGIYGTVPPELWYVDAVQTIFKPSTGDLLISRFTGLVSTSGTYKIPSLTLTGDGFLVGHAPTITEVKRIGAVGWTAGWTANWSSLSLFAPYVTGAGSSGIIHRGEADIIRVPAS